MIRFLTAVAAGGFLLGAAAGTAWGFDPTARFSIAGQVGLGGTAMSDVNDGIDRGNLFAASQNWNDVDALSSGFNFTFDLRADITGPWMVSAGIQRLTASTGVDFDQVIEVKPKYSLFHGRLLYRVPYRPFESIRFSLGTGVLFVNTAELAVSHEHRNVEAGTLRIETLTLENSGTGFQGFLEAEVVFNELATMVTDVGYRYLNTTNDSFSWKIERVENPDLDEDDDEIPNGLDLSDDSFIRHGFLPAQSVDDPGDIRNLQPTGMDLDYSGLQANVGLRFYLF